MTKTFFILSLLLTSFFSLAQTPCTTPGQNPATAFPVCGTATFTQNSVPLCGGRRVPANGCAEVTDVNPYWYKFTCFQSGTLGFSIKPHTNSEDYDWQLFDITGKDPATVYTNPALTIAFNWSGEEGETGASAAGTNVFVCDGFGKPLWSRMPNLIAGHEYLLLVSHFTQTQSGYDLSFGGGTAVITDTTPPLLKKAEAVCGGDRIRVKLNKKMKCSSIISNGSDFVVMPGNIPVISANPIGCSSGFDTDSVELSLGIFLPPGTYTVESKKGGDNNTILDYCDRAIPVGQSVSFTVYPLLPTPMDSIVPPTCAPQTLQLVFRKPMLCNTVASDGSDFLVTGPYPVSVTGAAAMCSTSSSVSNIIKIQLAQPLYTGGNFTITLRTGTDGNTVFDECGKETPAGSTISFTIKDTVNADFTFTKKYGCVNDTVDYFHPGSHGVNSWRWQLDENLSSTFSTPRALYQRFNTKEVRLIVSNGFCADTSYRQVALTNALAASFTVPTDHCPNDPVQFTSTAQGIKLSHHWQFGDGNQSALVNPQHSYAGSTFTRPVTVRYIITDSLGCEKNAQQILTIYSSCNVYLPSAFTPNNDGRNDRFGPMNAVKADEVQFSVFNRWGLLVYTSKDWKAQWDGRYKGLPQVSGVYVWQLSYKDRTNGEKRMMKGTVALIR